MNYENMILDLFNNGFLTTKDVMNKNIPKYYLKKLLDNQKIERVDRGIYKKKNDIIDDYVVFQRKSKSAIYSNLTSLYFHGFSDRIPIKYDVTVSSGYNGSLQKIEKINLFYIKKEYLDLGVIDFKLDSGNVIKVYDLERTICDIINNKNKLDIEIVNKAIREYYYNNKKDIFKLYNYAKKMNIYNKVLNTFEVLR